MNGFQFLLSLFWHKVFFSRIHYKRTLANPTENCSIQKRSSCGQNELFHNCSFGVVFDLHMCSGCGKRHICVSTCM